MITLTREEVQQVMDAILIDIPLLPCDREVKEHAIETLRARLAEKEQEPVAYASSKEWRRNQLMSAAQYKSCLEKNRVDFDIPLYTTPPQREWQGLTDEEIEDAGKLSVEGERMLPYSFASAIEAKLKEKNG